MARIKLEYPDKYIFKCEIPLRISDINYGGHLGNDSVLSIAHEARLQFLASLGYNEMDVEGQSIIMTDAVIVFKSEGFYGDILEIDIAVRDFTQIGCDLFYRILNKKSGKEIALVKTGIAFFNYSSHKITLTPERFIETINSL